MKLLELKKLYHSLGPGILLAATAIGVSHLIQSVQAGAKYGYFFIIMILLAHIIKYPFFEAAPRYSSVTKRSLLYGYFLLNPKYLIIYLIITLLSMFAVISAVSVVAGGILANILPFDLNIKIWSSIILITCSIILVWGKYELLDVTVKPIILLLTICTIIAVLMALSSPVEKLADFKIDFNFNNKNDILFLIAFLGWMPCPLDCSVWNSIWITEKKHNHPNDVYYSKSILDFRVGFFTTAILGIIFLMLGNLIFYSTGIKLSDKSISFIGQLFNIYTTQLGKWAFFIIALAAFLTMFSTVITCLDGFTRTLTRTIKLLFFTSRNIEINENKAYLKTLAFSLTGSLIIILFFLTSMKSLIYVATIISFLTAPFIAWFNLKLITDDNYPKKYHPSRNYVRLSNFFIIILVIFSIVFLYSRFN